MLPETPQIQRFQVALDNSPAVSKVTMTHEFVTRVALPTSVKDVLTYFGALALLLGTLRRLLLLGREGRFLLRFLLPFEFFGHGTSILLRCGCGCHLISP